MTRTVREGGTAGGTTGDPGREAEGAGAGSDAAEEPGQGGAAGAQRDDAECCIGGWARGRGVHVVREQMLRAALLRRPPRPREARRSPAAGMRGSGSESAPHNPKPAQRQGRIPLTVRGAE